MTTKEQREHGDREWTLFVQRMERVQSHGQPRKMVKEKLALKPLNVVDADKAVEECGRDVNETLVTESERPYPSVGDGDEDSAVRHQI